MKQNSILVVSNDPNADSILIKKQTNFNNVYVNHNYIYYNSQSIVE